MFILVCSVCVHFSLFPCKYFFLKKRKQLKYLEYLSDMYFLSECDSLIMLYPESGTIRTWGFDGVGVALW